MKKIILLLIFPLCGCSTIHQAKVDFQNFNKTIQLNAKQKVVYRYSYF